MFFECGGCQFVDKSKSYVIVDILAVVAAAGRWTLVNYTNDVVRCLPEEEEMGSVGRWQTVRLEAETSGKDGNQRKGCRSEMFQVTWRGMSSCGGVVGGKWVCWYKQKFWKSIIRQLWYYVVNRDPILTESKMSYDSFSNIFVNARQVYIKGIGGMVQCTLVLTHTQTYNNSGHIYTPWSRV